ncbi:MAG: electron transport complex subunit RsxG [Thioalkalivibrio sp.]|nr:electron transport complex subunit RsxG [Thioalkalivibrio sp.]
MARLVVRDVVITTLLLGLFAAIGTAVVAWVHAATEARIAENRLQMTRTRVTQVLEGLDYDNDPVTDYHRVSDDRLGGEDLPVWIARRGTEVVGVALSAIAPDGYSGDIHLLVGIDRTGTVRGVRITQHRETPGLGDDIEVERSDWIHDFRGRSLGDPPIERWRVRRDGGVFDQFTGATVTPRAVVRAVRNALLYFEANSEELLALPPPEEDEVLIIDPAVPEIPDHVTPTERLPEAEPPGELLQ